LLEIQSGLSIFFEMVKVVDIKNLENMSFEQAMLELDLIVRKLEGGKISLDEAVESFEIGLKL
jgi:exonuclease VII small subunit